ncbi:MAG: hypothetical protein GC154_14565 [bacterium]|nr:hypothetical protein [bacterium]
MAGQLDSQEKPTVQETLGQMNDQWGSVSTTEVSSATLQEFNDYATQLLEQYAPKMHYPELSVSMRADDPPTIAMNRIAVDVSALAYFMVDKKIWLPQSRKFLPFLGVTVENEFRNEFDNTLSSDARSDDEPEGHLSLNYDKILKDFPVIFYFSESGAKSIPILLDEFERKDRFHISTDYGEWSNNERRLRCAALIANILMKESGYQPEDITPEMWRQIAGETWRDLSQRMKSDDKRFQEAATLAFNGRMPFYLAAWAYPPDPVRYPKAKRDEKEYERIMKYVPGS